MALTKITGRGIGSVILSSDTASGDDANIGFTAAEGLILTGQGSTNDVTIKNDADANVIQVPTGTTNVTIGGNLSVGGDLDVTGNMDMSDANLTNVGTIALDSLSGDGDANTTIAFSGSDVITFTTGGTAAATLNASQLFTANAGVASTTGNFSGVVTANAGVVVDEMTLDGDTLTATDDFIIDAEGDITLDARADDFLFLSAGTHVGNLNMTSSNFTMKSVVSDGDLIFQGSDGGSAITALTLDMSEAGAATFNGNVTVGGDLDVTGSFDMSDANITNIGSISLDSITGDADANTSITFSGSDVITIATGGTTAATFNASQILTLADDLIIKDGGTIGSVSDPDAITISSGGVVTFSQTPVYSGDATFEDDIIMDSDGAILSMGEDNEITFTHVHNSGVTLTNTVNGTDDSPIVLQLKSEEDAIVADDVIASIEMAAGDSDGTDGATVAAGIHAIAEGTFSASANATKLVFTTGVSETAAASATAKMTLSSAGLLTIADDFLMKDGGTIGVASSTSAITIASSGIVTFVDDILIKDAGTIGSASDPDAIAIGADGDVTLTQDLELQHDGAILSFGANDEVTLTHVHDDGLLLNDDMQLQFRDSAINIRSDADGDLDINADDEIELNSTLIDINGNVEISGTTAQVGVSTSTAKDIFNAGMSAKNGSTSAGFVEFFEDSDNGANKVTLIGPASTADVTLTLPSSAGTIATTATAADEATALAIALG